MVDTRRGGVDASAACASTAGAATMRSKHSKHGLLTMDTTSSHPAPQRCALVGTHLMPRGTERRPVLRN